MGGGHRQYCPFTFPFLTILYKSQCYLSHIVSLSLNTFLISHVFDWLGFSVLSMYSTFAFPGVEELNTKIKVLDVAAFISTFRVTLVNNKTQRRLLPGTTHSLRSLKVTSSTQGSSTAARDATTHSLYRPGRPNLTRTNSYRSTIVAGQGQPLQAREALTTARDAYQHSSYRLGTQLPL